MPRPGRFGPLRAPGGGTRKREDHIFSSRVAAARLSCCRAGLTVRLAHRSAGKKTAITSGKASSDQPGKPPHKAFRPRVCKQIAGTNWRRQDGIVLVPVGTLWNSRIFVDCGGKAVPQLESLVRERPSPAGNNAQRASSYPYRQPSPNATVSVGRGAFVARTPRPRCAPMLQ